MLQPSELGIFGPNNLMRYETAEEAMDVQETDNEQNRINFSTIANGSNINFSNLTMTETIFTHCLVPNIENSKILVLICYNKTDPFGDVIINWLNHSDSIQALLSNSIFIACFFDITSDSGRHNLLKHLTGVVKDQDDIFYSVVEGKSRIFLLVPHYDIIISQSYIDDSMNEDNAVSMLFYMKDLFDDIVKLRLQEAKKNDAAVTCETFQQLMMRRLTDRSYDIFFHNQHQYLKDKIGFAYFGAPVNTDGTYTTKQNKTINKAYNAIVSQSDVHAMDDGVVIVSFIYICCLKYQAQRSIETNQLLSSVNKEEFIPLPCFVLRKCYDNNNPSSTCCRTIIDSTLRVYSSWDDLLHENTYAKCVLCVPTDGRYDCDDNGDVLLEYFYSPSCNIAQKALRAIDTTATVAGIGSGTLLLVATIPAIVIAPVALIGALAISAGAGLYSIGRSIHRLVDRSMHDEDLSPTEPEARAAYIGIIAGSLGFAGAGANVIISNLAKGGVQIGKGAIITVDAISKANIAAGGIALTNSVCDVAHSLIVKKEPPSALVFVQLGASVLFFTNAIYNYKNVSEIIAKAQANNAIQEYNNSLKIRRGSLKTGILSALKKSTNEDETIAMIVKNQEQFKDLGIQYAYGNVIYNGQEMNITQFTQAINTVDVTEVVPVTTNPSSKFSLNITLADLNSLALRIIPASSNTQDVELSVLNILQLFAPTVQRKLLDLIDKIFTSDLCKPTATFCDQFGQDLKENIKNLGINIEFITQIISCLVAKAEGTLNVNLGLAKGTRYVQVVVNYYLHGRSVTSQLVQECIEHLNLYVAKKVVNYIKGSEEKEKIDLIKKRKCLPCKKCNGVYHVKK